jgi:hypothetical protein
MRGGGVRTQSLCWLWHIILGLDSLKRWSCKQSCLTSTTEIIIYFTLVLWEMNREHLCFSDIVWYLVAHPSTYNITFHLHKNTSVWILCLSVNNFHWNVSMFGVPSRSVKLGQIYFLTISHTQHTWQDKIRNMLQLKHVAYITLSYMLCMTDFEKKYICNSKHNGNGSSQNS